MKSVVVITLFAFFVAGLAGCSSNHSGPPISTPTLVPANHVYTSVDDLAFDLTAHGFQCEPAPAQTNSEASHSSCTIPGGVRVRLSIWRTIDLAQKGIAATLDYSKYTAGINNETLAFVVGPTNWLLDFDRSAEGLRKAQEIMPVFDGATLN